MVSREVLKEVYQDTVAKCNTRYRALMPPDSSIYSYDAHKSDRIVSRYGPSHMVVRVVNMDTLVACEQYRDRKVCALNMASFITPGGGVVNGAMAQEEELFRRTNYFQTLLKSMYPMHRPNVVYSPRVTIIKDHKYQNHHDPFSCAFIAAAAIKNPRINGDQYHNLTDHDLMTSVVDNLFSCANYYQYDVLVLGALGCGAYHNPTRAVIEIFNEALKRYAGCFQEVVFAVYSVKDTNFDQFSQYIKYAPESLTTETQMSSLFIDSWIDFPPLPEK